MPAVRANWFKLVVGTAKREPLPRRERLLAHISDARRDRIRQAPGLAWLPAAEFAELNRVILDCLGEQGAHEFWRAVLRDALERPLLRPLRSGAMSLFGHNPGSLLRLTPQAWSLVTHGCGTIACEIEGSHAQPWEGECTLSFTGLTPEFDDPEVMGPLWVGGALATIDVLDCVGETMPAGGRLEPGSFQLRARWRDPSRPPRN